ncbi:uncharacterized protein CLUP02_00753 [Colletotrichum lupini]|uniref:Inhibitor I9 domain-containing protein n=1 Tax=Colletotrichum lupini TaxID=145971 RepID=A0A9Q8W8M7_9PEZI|nr:uncharacterized protein CLUP02_00753 [Colletotrichum lupini]UQC74106.1 hypothetical protein CLUP02_00753 [Colletotrichum lupini]
MLLAGTWQTGRKRVTNSNGTPPLLSRGATTADGAPYWAGGAFRAVSPSIQRSLVSHPAMTKGNPNIHSISIKAQFSPLQQLSPTLERIRQSYYLPYNTGNTLILDFDQSPESQTLDTDPPQHPRLQRTSFHPFSTTSSLSATMRPSTFLVAALAVVPGALAVDQMKSVIVWAKTDSVGDDIIQRAKQSIIDAGGQITHTYSLIRGFAAVTPAKVLESVQAFSESLTIEEDHTVTNSV